MSTSDPVPTLRPGADAAPPVDVLPGGFGRSTLAVGPWSPSAVRGAGCRVWDQDGRELLDANGNFTTLVLGHAEPAVVAAAGEALAAGASFGLPHAAERRHAELLRERIPGVEQVRYANSGTEAVMLALRIARAHRGRDAVLVVRGAYHGTADPVLPAGGPRSSRGVPAAVREQTLVVDADDLDAIAAAVERHGERLAAILVDLLPNRAGLRPIGDEALALLERARAATGALLVVDEVVSFRLGPGGLAPLRGVRPDLVTLGKAIGGGLPVGAVAGPAAVMGELDPRRPDGLEHGGTMTANPVTMAAGIATLERFDAAAIARLDRLGERARTALAAAIAPHGWSVRGAGSLLRPFAPAGEDQRARQLAVWWAAYERGALLTPNALLALSTPMDEAVVDALVERVAAAVAAVATVGPC
ncbi:aminotransferase class III-fold pyridoxal phosphate-dependent enzyme [Patulibacter defluvii]|uniref:aminotransferase class III-fold pyridoxal phosphate-dependent enzyme n=1 Tax=Patulibacter defluvii TaxID=3095358 RepID=UPI002A75DAC4|nr:aminotransferase class III-fold pyridoxal phosphate-dependent enzyme [Patulibacter sp. DM4]